ncbi:MAG TPA: ABC transporter ATP-binding protein [Acidobacteriaceae bacterium]|nr:ABC transporter ATP-binding protein [Acidobacteriaceae bacterium]
MTPLLQLDQLSIAFPTPQGKHVAVREVSLSIEPGEVLGLVGESGSGKSVLSLAILRLLDPRARVTGKIFFNEVDLLALPEAAMRARRGRDIAMIFQEPMTALNPVMPIGKQVAEAIATYHPELSRKEVRSHALEALESVAIPDVARRYGDYPHQFSGGQRQRILIAMAMVNHPRLLIADEPTTALDVTVQAQILDLLDELRQRYKVALLFISHDLSVVARIAQRVAVIRNGKILEEASREDIFRTPQNAYTRSLLAAVPTLHTQRDRPLATLTPE